LGYAGCINIIMSWNYSKFTFNPLNAKLNPICHLLALLGAHHILYVSRIRVNSIQINQPTRCSCFSRVYYSTFICGSTCFGRLPAHHQENTTALPHNRPDHDQQCSSRFLPKVEPEAPSVVVSSWWWAGRRPKRLSHIWTSSNKLIKNSCIWLVDLFESYDDARTCERQIYL